LLTIFSNRRIPFYYAEEATEAIKPMLGDLYHQDKRSFHAQLWSVFTTLKYVEPEPKMPGVMRWHKD
jgi:omega-6 fatty acid desaturase (delta-12 desaturase)